MNITTEYTPQRQAIVTVEVEPERLQKALQRAAQAVSRVRPLPGFRPGKAPYAQVERAVGRDLLLEQALEDLSREVFVEALKQENLDILSAGKGEIVQKEPPHFKFTVPLRPEVKLGDYSNLFLKPEQATVSDEEVEAQIRRLQLSQATLTPVTREAQKGDAVTLDIRGGAPGLEPLDEKNKLFYLGVPGQPGLPFEEQLYGMKEGETRTVIHVYADDHPDEAYRGRIATYEVTLQGIKETQLPELNDEFVKSVSQLQTLDQFRGSLRQALLRQRTAEAEAQFGDQVIDAIVDLSQVAYPPEVLEEELGHQMERLQEEAKRLGLTWTKFLELSGRSEAQVREDQKPAAEKQLKRTLVLLELVKKIDPPVTAQEIDQEIERRARIAEMSGESGAAARRNLSSRTGRSDLEFNLRVRKTVNQLVAQVKGEPTSGKILTPQMVREAEARARAEAQAQAEKKAAAGGVSPSGIITDPSQALRPGEPSPSGLITDPTQVPPEDWPRPQ